MSEILLLMMRIFPSFSFPGANREDDNRQNRQREEYMFTTKHVFEKDREHQYRIGNAHFFAT